MNMVELSKNKYSTHNNKTTAAATMSDVSKQFSIYNIQQPNNNSKQA